MQQNIIIKQEVEDAFESGIADRQIVLFTAPCGFGKSAASHELLRGKCVLEISTEMRGFQIPQPDGSWEILLVDNLQDLHDRQQQEELCELIRSNPKLKFVFLSRGLPPGWLMHFQYAGRMTTISTQDLAFDRDCVVRFMDTYGISLKQSEVTEVLETSQGLPLASRILAEYLSKGEKFSNALIEKVRRDVFFYFEDAIYKRFDLQIRRLLIQLSLFDSFTLDLARVVSGNNRVGELLGKLQRETSMLLYDGMDEFRFWEAFRGFLLWELRQECSEEQIKTLYNRGGVYYELTEEYGKAMECYMQSGDHSKISLLLIQNAQLHPGAGYYDEMEKYYYTLPESEILASPSLMQAMSMLSALNMDYEASEHWYKELVLFTKSRGYMDAAAKEARGRLAWLDISLPQRGVDGVLTLIPKLFRLIIEREISLPPFSVTSMLPSIMNGGKDFSTWSPKDDFLYKTMRMPVEKVLGRDGICIADCAVAESKFEKGCDISDRMIGLISHLNNIQKNGTPDIEFALIGLMVRSQIAVGKAEDAKDTLLSAKDRFEEKGEKRFFTNMNAMLCRTLLLSGDTDSTESWYREEAPRKALKFKIMKRYQYFTQAMIEIAKGENQTALMTLAPLKRYCETCERHIDSIHLNLLEAIAKYRRNQPWKENLHEALAEAEQFNFVRTIAEYGIAVLPLLEQYAEEKNSAFLKRVIEAARVQAVYYPDFLRPKATQIEPLTAAELQVLRLMCADKSNNEIGEILGIKLSTVKSHVSHILQKLGVKKRAEAKSAAESLNII